MKPKVLITDSFYTNVITGILFPLQLLTFAGLVGCAVMVIYMVLYICALRCPRPESKSLHNVPLGLAAGCMCSGEVTVVYTLPL